MADHAGIFWRAVIVCGICLDQNIIYDNHIGTHEPEAYKQAAYEMDCDMFDSAHNFRALWIFNIIKILDAFYFCHTIRARSGRD